MAMFPSASSVTNFPFLENLSNSLPSTTMVVKANTKMEDIMAVENMVIFHLPLPQPHSNWPLRAVAFWVNPYWRDHHQCSGWVGSTPHRSWNLFSIFRGNQILPYSGFVRKGNWNMLINFDWKHQSNIWFPKPPGTTDISRPRCPRRQCKIFQLRGFFSNWCVILCILCYFTHSV